MVSINTKNKKRKKVSTVLNWKRYSLGDVIETLEAGVSVNSSDDESHEYYILKTSSVSGGCFWPQQSKKIIANDISRAKLNPRKDSIIISRMNTPDLVGECAYVDQTYEKLFLPDRLWQTKMNPESKINVKWLNYLLNSPKYKALIKSCATGTSNSMKNISKESFLSITFSCPPFEEQNAITETLSMWDAVIIQTQQLITQLQQRNKGLMQELLTGKRRLKGFGDKWKRLHIYDIATEVSEKNRANEDLTVFSCTKYNGLVPSLEYFGRRVFGEDTSTYKLVPYKHFAYATNHIEEGSIGYQYSENGGLISPMYTVFKTNNKVDDDFLFMLLKTHQYIHEYQKRMEGSIDRRGGLRWDGFSKIPLNVPSLKEQQAIASFLNTAVNEVKLFENKLKSLKNQKGGLLQKLLTGEVRINNDASMK